MSDQDTGTEVVIHGKKKDLPKSSKQMGGEKKKAHQKNTEVVSDDDDEEEEDDIDDDEEEEEEDDDNDNDDDEEEDGETEEQENTNMKLKSLKTTQIKQSKKSLKSVRKTAEGIVVTKENIPETEINKRNKTTSAVTLAGKGKSKRKRNTESEEQIVIVKKERKVAESVTTSSEPVNVLVTKGNKKHKVIILSCLKGTWSQNLNQNMLFSSTILLYRLLVQPC